jgi:hypothetical protein
MNWKDVCHEFGVPHPLGNNPAGQLAKEVVKLRKAVGEMKHGLLTLSKVSKMSGPTAVMMAEDTSRSLLRILSRVEVPGEHSTQE